MKNKETKVEVEIEDKGAADKEDMPESDGLAPVRDALKSIMDDVDAGTFADVGTAVDEAIARLEALKEGAQSMGGFGASEEGMSIESLGAPADDE